MEIVTDIFATRALIARAPRPVGFVPTMGALHPGHLSLINAARAQCKTVAASVFVNPLQFAANEDLGTYPRDFEGDRAKLSAGGVDVLFAPDVATMYPPEFTTTVDVGEIGRTFEGAIRPTHFRGVATIVAKLLNIVAPDVLFLGQKDAQQTAVLRRMMADLACAARVEIVPTLRETDGLAMSSRNVYLNQDERAQAPSLYRALQVMRDAMEAGRSKSQAVIDAHAALGDLLQLDYFDVVDADTYRPLDVLRAPAFVIGAVRLGATRLLDNVWIAA